MSLGWWNAKHFQKKINHFDQEKKNGDQIMHWTLKLQRNTFSFKTKEAGLYHFFHTEHCNKHSKVYMACWNPSRDGVKAEGVSYT